MWRTPGGVFAGDDAVGVVEGVAVAVRARAATSSVRSQSGPSGAVAAATWVRVCWSCQPPERSEVGRPALDVARLGSGSGRDQRGGRGLASVPNLDPDRRAGLDAELVGQDEDVASVTPGSTGTARRHTNARRRSRRAVTGGDARRPCGQEVA